jgi:hypothetical protein
MDWEIGPKSRRMDLYLECVAVGNNPHRLGLVSAPSTSQWSTFAVLIALAILSQLVRMFGPSRMWAGKTGCLVGIFLLPLSLCLLVIIPHLWEWGQARLVKIPSLVCPALQYRDASLPDRCSRVAVGGVRR